jgi:hypothetical protein
MRTGMRRFLSTFLSLVLCLGLLPGGSSRAATLPLPTEQEAIDLLRFYQVVRGDQSGNLLLDKTLTRAEAATLFVRSLGKESEVSQQLDLPLFTDTTGHWSAKWVALAVNLKLMLGDGNGRFRPDDTITYAEVLTVLLRMTDQVLPNPWTPEAAYSAAQAIGIAPLGTQPTAPAIRAKIFWSLGSTISRIPLKSGKTLIQTYLDTIPPDLTLDQTDIITRDPAVTVSGTSFEAATLTINGKPVARDKSGRFTYKPTLKPGTTAIDIVATDKVGNLSARQVVITLLNPVGTITVTGPNTFGVGSENNLQVKVTDTLGQPVDNSELSFTMTGDVATYDPVTQTLIAGNIPGKGTLTLKAGRVIKQFAFTVAGPAFAGTQLTFTQINGGRALPTGKDVGVQVQVKDAAGKLLNTDNFRSVHFTIEGLTGVSPNDQSVMTQSGVANLTLKATREGTATITATADGLTKATVTVQFLSSPRIVLVPKATILAADGTANTTITAQLQDEAGKFVNAPTSLIVNLTLIGTDGTLSQSTATILAGKALSETVTLQAGVKPGQLTINGKVAAGASFSVQPATLELTGKVTGTQYVITGPATAAPGAPVALTVQVLDALNQPVKTGSYAYQVLVESSQGEPIVGGLPAGVTLTMAGSSYSPVDDGKTPSDPANDPDAVVGRTTNGKADLLLSYNQSGRLKLSVRLLPSTDEAFDATGSGPAIGTTGLGALPLEIVFQGAASTIRLTATSTLGTNMPAISTKPKQTVTVRAEVVDANGFVLTAMTPTITLTKATVGGMDISDSVGATTKRAVAGAAEFQVLTKDGYGYDVYTATSTASGVSGGSIIVANRKDRPLTPQIEEVRGFPSGSIGEVLPDDTHLEIRLFPQDAQFSGEPANWATAKVFRKGEAATLVSGVALDLSQPSPSLLIPRSRLKLGTATYEVLLNNGTGDSARSPDLGFSTAVTQNISTTFRITGALFDAATRRLVLTSAGLAATGSVDVNKLTLVAAGYSLTLDPAKVNLVSLTASAITLDLGTQAADLDPDRFFGNVKIVAADGWYDAGPGGSLAKGTEYTGLKPMARINHAALDPTGKFLYLYGSGLAQGTLDLSKLHLQKPGGATVTLLPGTTTAFDRLSSRTDTEVRISLSVGSLAALAGLTGSDLVIGADVGWLWSGTTSAPYKAPALTSTGRRLYAWVDVTAVTYTRATWTLTLTGKNLTGTTVDLAKLAFKAYGAEAVVWPRPTGSIVTAPVAASSDTKVEIVLNPADAATFESTYEGRQLYLYSTGDWLHDAGGRAGVPLPANKLLLSVRSN